MRSTFVPSPTRQNARRMDSGLTSLSTRTFDSKFAPIQFALELVRTPSLKTRPAFHRGVTARAIEWIARGP